MPLHRNHRHPLPPSLPPPPSFPATGSLIILLFLVLMDDHKEDEAISELSKAIFFKSDLQLLHLRAWAAFHESLGCFMHSPKQIVAVRNSWA